MEPANPPLPTPWNLPFQPEAGSQTSSLISESLDGFSTSETRQNAAVTSIGRLSGGVNEPAATDCALEMAALGNATLARSSHVAAKAAACLRFPSIAPRASENMKVRIVKARPLLIAHLKNILQGKLHDSGVHRTSDLPESIAIVQGRRIADRDASPDGGYS